MEHLITTRPLITETRQLGNLTSAHLGKFEAALTRAGCRCRSDRFSAPTPPPKYVPDMSNRFGIELDQTSLRWAAAEGVSETVIAAVSLLHQRSVEEIAGKLTSAELVDVTRLVSRCPSCYPPGAYDALKSRRDVTAEQPATRPTSVAGANRPRQRLIAGCGRRAPVLTLKLRDRPIGV
jgi:hypothetical protein